MPLALTSQLAPKSRRRVPVSRRRQIIAIDLEGHGQVCETRP